MGATSVIVLALLALAAADVVPGRFNKPADKETLIKQKHVLQLLLRNQQPTYFQEIREIGNNYKLVENLNKYKNQSLVEKFWYYYQHDYFQVNDNEFNHFLDGEYLEKAKWIFDVLFNAQDYETFYKTACWFRVNILPSYFSYAYWFAVIHRPDTQNVVLPPPYEVIPQFFIRNDIIQRAYQAKMRGYEHYYDICDFVNDNSCVLVANYTRYGEDLRYFTEDVGLNAFYQYWHGEHPYWFNSKEYPFKFENRGELFLYFHRQILAHYVLERISHGYGEVEPVHLWEKIEEGYYPHLRYPNGNEISGRSDYSTFFDYGGYSVNEVYQYERRIYDAIDSGYVFSKDGQKYELFNPKGLNLLGEIIMGVSDSVNKPYYGALYNYLRILAGGLNDQSNRYSYKSGALHHYSTSLRDPLFYRLIQRINNLWERYVERLGPYQYEELVVPGIKLEKVEIEKLITYFDHFDVALNNVVDVANEEDAKNVNILARLFRLNHQPFTYTIHYTAEKSTKAIVRVFLGPKYDQYGRDLPLSESYQYFVELDRFPFSLQEGQNIIARNSRDSNVAIEDLPSFTYLYKNVQDALEGKTQFYVEENHRSCGYPDRLVLPRGNKQGQVYSLYVHVSEYPNEINDQPFHSLPYCGPAYNSVNVDNKPAGYPFNRPVKNQFEFNVPNSYFKDVVIFHKTQEEVNSVQDV